MIFICYFSPFFILKTQIAIGPFSSHLLGIRGSALLTILRTILSAVEGPASNPLSSVIKAGDGI
jgi:hypothetical protein